MDREREIDREHGKEGRQRKRERERERERERVDCMCWREGMCGCLNRERESVVYVLERVRE